VAGVLPWLLTEWRSAWSGGEGIVPRGIGGALIVAGSFVLIRAFASFVIEGLGTPAPVAPPEHLVVGGLYRYVRNPMYVAVLAVILGQALLLGRAVLVAYAATVGTAMWVFVRGYEEPTLLARYGHEYVAYRRRVPGWLPTLRRRRCP
jgi:protein-S-isoprenylcysteine O-methyltransferase Ste14